ncbi:phage tail protein [Pseudomonas atacamensis]|uniref:phage tail assembly chaperone n=1 Tax=Pseudomonas atacamensis TaxID=2565368 RepID=UPI002B463D3D|nr:phage tail protein [Pseudomonas atacamensis]MEB2855513.1 phage tail protein [Pseudomonas atacamensis]
MKMFYSPSQNGMFNDAIYGRALPQDAVLIPAERVNEILEGLGLQKALVVGDDGLLVLVDPVPMEPTVEQLAAAERAWRDAEVLRISWLRDRHRDQVETSDVTTLTPEQFNELLVYMQALRDWPQSPNFPAVENRPIAPDWIAGQTQ